MKGQVVMRGQTATHAGPSVQGPSRLQECGPRTQRRRPAVGRNASRKRKAVEVDGESADETEEERPVKVCTSQVYLFLVAHVFYSGSSVAAHEFAMLFTLFGTVLHFYCFYWSDLVLSYFHAPVISCFRSLVPLLYPHIFFVSRRLSI
jgi:hypothetical protein